MDYRKMKGTGLKVSALCLGTMTFGKQTDEAESANILHHAIDHGVNFIDTADAYNHGESEKIVGRAIKGKREQLVLATKVRFKVGEGVNDGGLNRRHMIRQIDNSLKSLQTDYVDIYYMHAMDKDTPLEETLEVMTDLVRAGKVRYVGVSNHPAWQIGDMLWKSDTKHLAAPVVTQNRYNLIKREVEPELVPFINAHNIGMTVYNPIAGGLLTGKHKKGAPEENTRFALNSVYMERYWHEDNFNYIEELESVAAMHQMSLLELSLKWCLSHAFVDSIICGASRLSQIEQNIKAIDGAPLDKEVMQTCDAIWAKYNDFGSQYFK